MPTTITKTIKTSGGDYTSLSAWEAGQQADIVAADQIQQAECYALVDTTEFTIDGWTTDATRYIRIFAATGEGHSGYWDTAKFLFRSSGVLGVNIEENFVRFEGLQFEHTDANTATDGVRFGSTMSSTSEVRFSKCLFKMIQSGGSGTGALVYGFPGVAGGALVRFYNCVFWDAFNTDFPTSTIPKGAVRNEFTRMELYNCTIYNSVWGINSQVSGAFTTKAVNCLSYCDEKAAAFTDFNGTFTSSNFNASTDATAPGANSIINQANTDIDFESETETNAAFLAILTTSTCVGAGTNDPLSGVYSDDIRGQTRTSTWDIGADEFVAAAPERVPQSRHYLQASMRASHY